jgi:hypothetical protein
VDFSGSSGHIPDGSLMVGYSEAIFLRNPLGRKVAKPSKWLRIGLGTGSRLGVRNLGSRRTPG